MEIADHSPLLPWPCPVPQYLQLHHPLQTIFCLISSCLHLKGTRSLPKEIALCPDDTMNRFTGGRSDRTDWKGFRGSFSDAIETLGLVLSRQLVL
jgi:hypothetical protein